MHCGCLTYSFDPVSSKDKIDLSGTDNFGYNVGYHTASLNNQTLLYSSCLTTGVWRTGMSTVPAAPPIKYYVYRLPIPNPNPKP